MNFIMQIFGIPLGWIMWLMYTLVKNYALTLLLFTVVIKLCMIPLAVKQQQSNIKMQRIRPKIQELQAKYKNNQRKLQEELTELYRRENYSMSAGCLPLLIQLPILFGLLDVIYKPLTHIMRIPADVIAKAQQIAGVGTNISSVEISILNMVQDTPEKFAELGADMLAKIQSLDMTAFGLNLSMQPLVDNNYFTWYMLIPIISAVTAFAQGYIMQKASPASAEMGGMKYMNVFSAVMSFSIATVVPRGVGMYWIFSNIFGICQTLILNKIWDPQKIAAQLDRESEERRERERQERIEAKKYRADGEALDGDEYAGMTKKERDRLRLAEARRRNAEKYGDYGPLDD